MGCDFHPSVSGTDTNLVATAIAFVDGYNRLRDKLDDLTEFNADTGTGSLLSSDGTTLRLQNDLARLLSRAISGVGSLRSLESLGITLTDAGKLQLDQQKLKDQYGAAMPRTLNLITGPSRSGDIEQTILMGAHGPKRLHIILVGET